MAPTRDALCAAIGKIIFLKLSKEDFDGVLEAYPELKVHTIRVTILKKETWVIGLVLKVVTFLFHQ